MASKLQVTAENAGQDAGVKKLQGALYDGEVKSFNPNTELYEVEIEPGSPLTCQHLSPIFSRMLGVQFKYIIPVGTRVKVVDGPTPCIIGALPGADPETDTKARNNRSVTGEPIRSADASEGVSPQTQGIPSDLLEGELDLTNEFRVGLQVLLGLARLTAGEKAVVETLAYNDMVRIVSEVFKHHSSFGDEEIYNDGRLNKVEHGTSYDHEAWGATDEDDSVKATTDDEGAPLVAAGDAGRWRYSRYMGFLGDFIHMFVSDPTATAGNMYDAAARAGKARVQIMSDGTLLAQTVSEVVIERVSRVTIPVQKQKWDSPDGNLASTMDSLNDRYVQLWKGLKSSRDRQDLADMAYQLREYARWLNTFHSFSRFLQQDKDWTVPPETSQESPSWGNQEKSVENVNESSFPLSYDTYACIRIMRDGSILLWSGDGSSVTMAGGSVQVHASRNLDLRAAGDIRIHAGRDLHMHARRHIDVVALVGGLRAKARNYLEMLSTKGSMLLRSDAADPSAPGYTEETGTVDNPAATVREHAVTVQTTKGRSIINSQQNLKLSVTGAAYEGDEESSAVSLVSSSGDVNLTALGADNGVNVTGSYIKLRALRDLWVDASNFISKLTADFAILGPLGESRLHNRGGVTTAQRVNAETVDARVGLLSYNADENKPTEGRVGVTAREEAEDPMVVDLKDAVEEWADVEVALELSPFKEGVPEFEYPADEYSAPDRHRETLTDQFLRKDLPADWTDQYGTWTPQDFRTGGKRGPYSPEEENALQHNPTSGTGDLREASSLPAGDLPVEATGFDPKPTRWNYLKDE